MAFPRLDSQFAVAVFAAIVLVVVGASCATSSPTGSPASSLVPSAGESESDLNPVEMKLAGALMGLGIASQRAEHSFSGAFLWSEFGDGSAMYVSGYPIDIPPGDFAVVDEREVGGVSIQSVRYEGGIVRDRFECADLNVEVDGATPPDYADMDEFLQDYVVALGCSG